jgi:CheY-like chemotaxis protein
MPIFSKYSKDLRCVDPYFDSCRHARYDPTRCRSGARISIRPAPHLASRRRGYQVAAVANPVQLRQLVQTTSIHAVIATGTGSWPRDCTELRDVPVLTCPLHTIHEAAANLGVVDYLRKPVSRAQLRSSLGQIGLPIRDVLVVDDVSDMTRLLARMVRAEFKKCHVATARDGRRALDLLHAGPLSVVLLDLVMPHFDGYWLLNQMRADENLRDVPVVIVTARGDEVETVVASGIEISRNGGLVVGDAMVCLQRSLDWLLRRPGATDIARAPLEDRVG